MVYHAANDKPYGDDLRHSIQIVGGNGAEINITQQVLEFTIYESLFRNFISADFVIRDAEGIIDSLPIVGQEQIIVTFSGKAARLGVRKQLLFKLYKVTGRQKIAGDAHVYVLKGASFELEKNLSYNVNPYYKDKLGSEIVQNVYDEYISVNSSEKKPIFIEPTENVVPFTGTGHNPFDIIKHVAKHSRSAEHTEKSFYLFYETREQFNFRTLASLFNAEQQFDYVYEFSDPGAEAAQRTVEGARKSIIGFTFLDTVDTVSSLKEGLYDNNTTVIDPLTKTYTEIGFNYARDFDSIAHIQGGGKPTIRTAQDIILGQNAGGPSHNRFICDNLNVSNQNQTFDNRITANNDPQTYFSTERHKHVTNSIVQEASIKQHGIAITVPSNLNIVPGHIITIRIPTNNEFGDYIKHYGKDAKFLVTAASNRLTKNGDYVTNLECVKESFSLDINGNPVFTLDGETANIFEFLANIFLITQNYGLTPFGVDRSIGLISGVLSFLGLNNVLNDVKDAAVKDISDGVENALSDQAEEATDSAVESVTDAAADTATAAVENAAASIEEKAGELEQQAQEFLSEENIKNLAVDVGTTLVVSKLSDAIGLSPAKFQRLIQIVKLLQKIPIFKSPLSSAETALKDPTGAVKSALTKHTSGGE